MPKFTISNTSPLLYLHAIGQLELLARRIAIANNMLFTGTLGVLLKAKQVGYIHEVKPYINALCDAGLWISEVLIHTVLTKANEI